MAKNDYLFRKTSKKRVEKCDFRNLGLRKNQTKIA